MLSDLIPRRGRRVRVGSRFRLQSIIARLTVCSRTGCDDVLLSPTQPEAWPEVNPYSDTLI